MSAVWGRLRAASSSEVLQLPLNKRARRDHQGLGRAESREQLRQQQQQQGDPNKTFWQNNFDSKLNALGISNEPERYEIQKGRTVPRYGDAKQPPQLEASPPIGSIEDDVNTSPVFAPPPPRNPLRRLQSHPDWRPTSSIYDLDIAAASPSAVPSPLQVTSARMDPQTAALQISPPSSPDLNSPERRPSPDDVSPIDDDFDMAQQQMIRGQRRVAQGQAAAAPKAHASPPRSNIPTMRRDRRKQQEAAFASRRELRSRDGPISAAQPAAGLIPRSDGMRWDRDGSPTFGRSTLSPPPPADMPMGCTTTITGPARSPRNQPSPSFGERVRQFGIARAKPEPMDTRPAWNGASGRTAVVQPVRDDLNTAPLQAPPKHAKRAGRGRGFNMADPLSPHGPTHPGSSETPSGPATTTRRMMPAKLAQQQQQEVQRSPIDVIDFQPGPGSPDRDGAQAYPSPPYSGSPMRMSPETAQPSQPPTTTTSSTAAEMPIPPIVIPDAEKAIKRKPPPAHSNRTHAAHNSTSSSIYSTQPAQRVSTASKSADDDGWVQPPSRFSISTRATSHTGSPRPSGEGEDRPPLPEPTAQVTSMMDRSRHPRGDDSSNHDSGEPVVISMKPFGGLSRKEDKTRHDSAMQAAQRRKNGSIDANNGRPLSVMSTSKALPPAPPELMSANDRVGNLNARLDNLAHRRNNINRSIKQMTELMPTDNLLASAEVLRKRESERLKVEGLREELAGVQQEEYELGLKLHRAYKRLDRDAEFEPTGLWVRRVTG